MGRAKGNATEAARIAGYRSPRAEGSRLLTKAAIREAIHDRVQADPQVKDREKLQRWWSGVVDDAGADLGQRLRASELLAKSQGVFTQPTGHESPTDHATDAELEAELERRGFVRPKELARLD